MLLSEAIRLGAMLNKQCRFESYRNGRTCAYGAALRAVGVKQGDLWDASPATFWPWIDAIEPRCPACGHHTITSRAIISEHLNDQHGWTREQIADWVEGIERERGLIPTKEETLQRQIDGMNDTLTALVNGAGKLPLAPIFSEEEKC